MLKGAYETNSALGKFAISNPQSAISAFSINAEGRLRSKFSIEKIRNQQFTISNSQSAISAFSIQHLL
jgi:hypothetical protein